MIFMNLLVDIIVGHCMKRYMSEPMDILEAVGTKNKSMNSIFNGTVSPSCHLGIEDNEKKTDKCMDYNSSAFIVFKIRISERRPTDKSFEIFLNYGLVSSRVEYKLVPFQGNI